MTTSLLFLFLSFPFIVTGYSTGFDQCRDEPGHGTQRSPPNGALTAYALRMHKVNTVTMDETFLDSYDPSVPLLPNEEYHLELYSPSPAGLTFNGFIMNSFTLPFNGYTDDTPIYGSLEPLSPGSVRLQIRCNGGVTHRDAQSKRNVRVKWIPPMDSNGTISATGPLLFTAIVIRDYHAWYRATLCVTFRLSDAAGCPSYFLTPYVDPNVSVSPLPSFTPLLPSPSSSAAAVHSPDTNSTRGDTFAWSASVQLTPFLSLSWTYLPVTIATDNVNTTLQRRQRLLRPNLFTEPSLSVRVPITQRNSSSKRSLSYGYRRRRLSSSIADPISPPVVEPSLLFRLESTLHTWISLAIAADKEGLMSNSDAIVIQPPSDAVLVSSPLSASLLNDIIHQYRIQGHSLSSVVKVPDNQQTLLPWYSSFRYRNDRNKDDGFIVEFARTLRAGTYPNAKNIAWPVTLPDANVSLLSLPINDTTNLYRTPLIGAWGTVNALTLDRHRNSDVLRGSLDFSVPFRGNGNFGTNTNLFITNEKISTITTTITLIIHIACMVIAWIVMVPLGILLMRKKQKQSRTRGTSLTGSTTTTTAPSSSNLPDEVSVPPTTGKGFPVCFCCNLRIPLVHTYLQSLALGLTLIGMIMGLLTVPSDNHFTEFHHILGLFFIVLTILPVLVRLSLVQTFLVMCVQLVARWNPKGPAVTVYTARSTVRSYHKYTGYFIAFVSIVPMVTGILTLNVTFRYILLYVYLSLVTVAVVGGLGYNGYLECRSYCRWKGSGKRGNDGTTRSSASSTTINGEPGVTTTEGIKVKNTKVDGTGKSAGNGIRVENHLPR